MQMSLFWDQSKKYVKIPEKLTCDMFGGRGELRTSELVRFQSSFSYQPVSPLNQREVGLPLSSPLNSPTTNALWTVVAMLDGSNLNS